MVLVVLDRPFGAADTGPIGDTTVVGMIVGGEFVFESPNLESEW